MLASQGRNPGSRVWVVRFPSDSTGFLLWVGTMSEATRTTKPILGVRLTARLPNDVCVDAHELAVFLRDMSREIDRLRHCMRNVASWLNSGCEPAKGAAELLLVASSEETCAYCGGTGWQVVAEAPLGTLSDPSKWVRSRERCHCVPSDETGDGK